jgi:Raf kinase inhibitor-like YbhB/YbcL family protein
MNRNHIMIAGAAVLAVIAGIVVAQQSPPTPMTLTSSSFADGGVIPDKYTQASATPVSPELSWMNAPTDTASFTLILHDPDAAPQRKSEDVLHWMMFNIPGSTHALTEGIEANAQMPDGAVQAKNLSGKVGFMGPGARNVYHHYTFELYALDTKLSLGPDATRADVLKAMDGHIIAKAAYEGRFHR